MIILHRIGTLITEFADYMAKVNTVTELSHLSDQQLQDIGITRAQLNMGVKNFWVSNDKSAAQASIAKSTDNHTETSFDFGHYLVSMYSAQNRPGYMI